jgi:hypothetical protein
MLFLFQGGSHAGPHRPSVDYLSQRLYSQLPMKKRADDEESHPRTSSMSSTTAPPVIQPPMNQKLSVSHDSSANVKVYICFPIEDSLSFFHSV